MCIENEFRLYVAKVNHPSKGTLFYAGQKKGKYSSYTGSGRIIKAYKSKYGKEIVEMNWLEEVYTAETIDGAEISLINKYKETHGKRCINIAGGGHNGNNWTFMSEEDQIKRKKSIATSSRKSPLWEEDSLTKLYSYWVLFEKPKSTRFSTLLNHLQCEDFNIKPNQLSAIVRHFETDYNQSILINVSVPDDYYEYVKEQIVATASNLSKSTKRRTSEYNHMYDPILIKELNKHWLSMNKPSYVKFTKLLTNIGYDYTKEEVRVVWKTFK